MLDAVEDAVHDKVSIFLRAKAATACLLYTSDAADE